MPLSCPPAQHGELLASHPRLSPSISPSYFERAPFLRVCWTEPRAARGRFLGSLRAPLFPTAQTRRFLSLQQSSTVDRQNGSPISAGRPAHSRDSDRHGQQELAAAGTPVSAAYNAQSPLEGELARLSN